MINNMSIRPFNNSHVCRPLTSTSSLIPTFSLDNLPDCPSATSLTSPSRPAPAPHDVLHSPRSSRSPSSSGTLITAPQSLYGLAPALTSTTTLPDQSRSTSPPISHRTSRCDRQHAARRLSDEQRDLRIVSPGLGTISKARLLIEASSWDDAKAATKNVGDAEKARIDDGKAKTSAVVNGELTTTAILGQQSRNASDEQDQKRRKLTDPAETLEDLPLARIEDIGRTLGIGGTGEVFKYKSNLVLKVYIDSETFDNESRAYSQISASSLQFPIPHVKGKILLSQSFLSRYFFNNDKETYTPHYFGLVLQRLQGPLLCDLLDKDYFGKLKLDILQEEVEGVVRRLHDIGISHGDIKGNNLMFRVPESKGWSINKLNIEKSNDWFLDSFLVEEQYPVHMIDRDIEDWCIFDFG
ncbi:hypothetical protein DL98DRAFT_315122 [Cadophora sp. DSE1049]|nr:hypothetical protein DL98DRAFT_315122 [Cadophora sp. DSE1049]